MTRALRTQAPFRAGAQRSAGVAAGLAAPRAPWLLALLSAALVVLAGRPWGVPVLAWFALVPAFAALTAARAWWTAASLALLASLGPASVAYEPAAAIGAGWYLLAVLLGALPFAAAGAAGWAVARRLPVGLRPVTFALSWALAELLPAQPALLGAYALPLNLLGYSQAEQPAAHLARFSSVTAVSLALLLANALWLQVGRALLTQRAGRAARAAALPLAGLLLLALAVAAAWLTAPAPSLAGPTLEVAVAQPNRPTALLAVAQEVPPLRHTLLADMAALAAPATGADGGGPVDLLVWPEAAWPGVVRSAGGVTELDAADLAALAALPPSLVGAAGRTADGASSNSAFLWTGVELLPFYDKLHLVPVAEAGLKRGTHLPLTPLPGLAAAPSICYDVLFPATVRGAALRGADLIAVLTDDAFAARGDVPRQHLRVARFRAVESGLPVAFASNTGPSAIFDGAGRVLAASEAGEAALLRATLGSGTGPTPYVRYGDWAGALACLAAGLLALAAARGVAGTKGGAPSSQRSA